MQADTALVLTERSCIRTENEGRDDELLRVQKRDITRMNRADWTGTVSRGGTAGLGAD